MLLCQVITLDPSKYCHAVKQLADAADDSEKHIDGLTWQLDDISCRRPSNVHLPVSDDTAKSLHAPSKKLNSNSCTMSKIDQKRKGSSSESKSQVSNDSHLQQRQVDSESVSPSSKQLKLDGSSNKTTKLEKKQKIRRNKSASFSGSDVVDKLSDDKKLKRAGAEVKSDQKANFSKSKVQLNRDQGYWSKEEIGIVSFDDEAETNDSFPACRQIPQFHVQEGAMSSEFESAILDQYVDRGLARNVGRRSSGQRTDHDSSDEDVFDLIASGRINKVMRQSDGSQSRYEWSERVVSSHQGNQSSASAVMASKRQTVDREVDNYDSASSADTDVIIRSHRLMSEVTANLRNQNVGSFQPNPNTALNITSQQCNASSHKQLSDVGENLSPSQSLAEGRCGTERKRKSKRLTGDGLEATAKNCVVSADESAVQDENIVLKDLAGICHSAECKRKRKPLKVADSEVAVKNHAFNADRSPVSVQAAKSTALPTADGDDADSNFERHKSDVSLLLINNNNMHLLFVLVLCI